MKKAIILTLAVLSIAGLSASAQTRNGLVLTDTQLAIDYLYSNGLTQFGTTQTFMASNALRRDEAAAFFARFARDVLGMVPDTSKAECNTFTDLSQGHHDLQGEIRAACQLGLMRGSAGKFMPAAAFSNAHALTVVVRLLDGNQSEAGAHWASNYLLRARALGLTSGLSADNSNNLDVFINRGQVARLIEAGNVYKNGESNTTQNNPTNTNHSTQQEQSIQKLVLSYINTPGVIYTLDTTNNTTQEINYTQPLLIPTSRMEGTLLRYLYFIEDIGIGIYDITDQQVIKTGLPWILSCEQNCHQVIGSFTDTESLLIVAGLNDEGGGFTITSGYIYNIVNDQVINLPTNIINEIGEERACKIIYDGLGNNIYNLGCDGNETRIRINIENNTTTDINTLKGYDHTIGGFRFSHNRTLDNEVVMMDIYNLKTQTNYTLSHNQTVDGALPLAYAYYFNDNNNYLIQLGESSYCVQPNGSKTTLNTSIQNYFSVLDKYSNKLYITTTLGIQAIDILTCQVTNTLLPQNMKIEGYLAQ